MKHAYLICMILLLAACGSQQPDEPRPLAASVPTQARTIVKADLDAVLKMADCSSQGGKITLAPNLSELLDPWDGLPLLTACAADGDRLDLSKTYWIDLGEAHAPVITAMLRQPASVTADALVDSLSGGVMRLCDGRQAWLSMATGSELASMVDTILARANECNLLNSQGIEHEFFVQSSSILAMRRCPADDEGAASRVNPLGDAYDAVFMSCDIHDRSIAALIRIASAGQWVDATSLMQPIDAETAFADQPPGSVLAAAAGVTTGSVCRVLSAIPGLRFDRRFTLSIYARILAVNGTATLAIAPGGRAETIRNFDLNNWDTRLTIPIQGDPVKALDFADRYLPANCYVEADSLCLYASTYEPGTYPSYDNLAPALDPGCRLAIAARIPYRSETMKALRLRSGYSLDIQADSAVRVNLRVLGPADYILPALLDDL